MNTPTRAQWSTALTLPTDSVLRQFARLDRPGTIATGKFVYLPGSRAAEERVLMVAHADTVWDHRTTERKLEWKGRAVVGRGSGCGADDRAGCMAAWQVAQQGEHSVLITTGEERGGIGAEAAVNAIGEMLEEHAWALQVDRAGDQEYVFYDGTECDGFADWLRVCMPDWHQGWGTFTDIAIICPAVALCGINAAAGYLFEHTHNEVLMLDAWERTMRQCVWPLLALREYPVWQPDVVQHAGLQPWWKAAMAWGDDKDVPPTQPGKQELAWWEDDEDMEEVMDVHTWMQRRARTNAAGDVVAYDKNGRKQR